MQVDQSNIQTEISVWIQSINEALTATSPTTIPLDDLGEFLSKFAVVSFPKISSINYQELDSLSINDIFKNYPKSTELLSKCFLITPLFLHPIASSSLIKCLIYYTINPKTKNQDIHSRYLLLRVISSSDPSNGHQPSFRAFSKNRLQKTLNILLYNATVQFST
jgi:hypothetical protein